MAAEPHVFKELTVVGGNCQNSLFLVSQSWRRVEGGRQPNLQFVLLLHPALSLCTCSEFDTASL